MMMSATAPGRACAPGELRAVSASRQVGFVLGPIMLLVGALAAGCATAPLEPAGSLQSYEGLVPSDGMLTRSRLKVDTAEVLAAKTAKIVPTTFLTGEERAPFTQEQRNLVANAVDRTLCAGLSERFEIVAPAAPADLTVHAVIIHATPTDPVAAGLSRGASVAKSVLLPGVPVPVPRIPIGLGSLSLEADARDREGRQKAAMIWGRGANALLGSGRVAAEGDAYGLAAEFGADFSALLVTGKTPFGKMPSLPSLEKLGSLMGRAAKYPACEMFGKSPGVVGFIGERMGLPPSWTDTGAAPP